jgi:hypothetical protein
VLARERKLALELIFGETLSGLASIVYFRGIYLFPRRLDERPIVPMSGRRLFARDYSR